MNNKFFEDLKSGLEDAIAYKQGKLNLRSKYIEIPKPPAKEIKEKSDKQMLDHAC